MKSVKEGAAGKRSPGIGVIDGADCALVEVELVTGRSHQIRVHFSEAGHPLLGDRRYG
ncbi:MAG: pseudouridine synthase [Syntrophotaleaceae bacterium]